MTYAVKKPALFSLLFLLFSCFAVARAMAEVPTAKFSYIKKLVAKPEMSNDIYPVWSNDGNILSIERYDPVSHNLVLFKSDGETQQTVSVKTESDNELDLLMLDNVPAYRPYSADLSWHPDSTQFVFTSNGGLNNFDLYLGRIGTDQTVRLTEHVAVDSQPAWSPDGKKITFVSSRDGNSNLYWMSLPDKQIHPLLINDAIILNPVWSPDGQKIAFIQGSASDFDVFVMEQIESPSPRVRQLTHSAFRNNVRPNWSPDGRKIAFFSRKMSSLQDESWDILVINNTIERALIDSELDKMVVAKNVIHNSHYGPAWLPSAEYIAFAQQENEDQDALMLVGIRQHDLHRLTTSASLIRNISCSRTGVLAFQSLDERWSQIFIAKLPESFIR